MSSYVKIWAPEGPAYVKRGRLSRLNGIKGIVFDCDGVLVDARDSYNRAIIDTVHYMVKELTGLKLRLARALSRTVYQLRRSGGFNNDWDSTYAILLQIFSKLPIRFLKEFEAIASSLQKSGDPYERLGRLSLALKGVMNQGESGGLQSGIEAGLRGLAQRADERGTESIERALFSPQRRSREVVEALSALKEFLRYPGDVGRSPLTTIFDELYYGPDLFYKLYGMKARINLRHGLIENERAVITRKTLKLLSKIFGPSNLGIASGRSLIATEYTLRDLMRYMNREAMVFLEDEERRARSSGGVSGKVGKPEPFSLLKAARHLDVGGQVMYVGNSREDLIMVERCNAVEDRFLFAGVYAHSHSPREQIALFTGDGADLVIPSVNDLPEFYLEMRGGRVCE